MKNIEFYKNLKNDFPASVVVFFVAIPLCLGIALASGAPLFSGLIAGIIGGIVVGLISGSQVGVSGPAAGLAAIVLTAITSLGSFETFLLAIVLGGVIQLLLGLFKAGIIGYYFPSSVIRGMLTGIGLIIIIKQLPFFFGYNKTIVGEPNELDIPSQSDKSWSHDSRNEQHGHITDLGKSAVKKSQNFYLDSRSIGRCSFWDHLYLFYQR